jgi:predicted ATPase/class 3 adenylate cyclase
MAAPTGTITFLFTDIEGSTKKWERHPEAMRRMLGKHDTILRSAFEEQGGLVFKTVGDAFCVAFDTAQGGLNGALAAQRALRREDWAEVGELRVRMSMHTGAAEHRDGDYFGQALNRVARILAAAHGGQVLLSVATQELLRDNLPEGTQLRSLGEHRLRDLARAEHVFQLVVKDLPSDFPPLRSLESIPNNLPIQLTSFVGREKEMAEVKRLLGSTRLLTLSGMGGTGKTRLSLQVAAEVLDSFPDGVWFVEFATIDDAAVVPETVASALDLRQEAERSLTSTLTAFLRGKRLLLIFDNCEHVVTACARLAETLLRVSPNLRIMASSREPLGIAGETAWPVPPLSLPDHWREIADGPDAIERLTQYEAVRLFIDRARIARPGFQLTNENAPTIARICWRLDGIALAIELAAARVKVLTLQQIVERLDDRFHLLTTGSRTAVPRQQTLRSLIDWSYDLLSEPERKLLRRLAVFARGRTLEAIEAVCSGDGVEAYEVVDLLTQLVDKSLVTVEKSVEHGARYFMLESLWDYANEKLIEAGESDTYRLRHLDHFLKYAEEAEPKIMGPEQKQWLSRIEPDDFNFRYAIETSSEMPGQAAKGLRMLAAMERHVEVRGFFKDAREDLARLLRHPDTAARDTVRARALVAGARMAWICDDIAPGEEAERGALEIWQELGDARGTAVALGNLALYAVDAGDLSRAKALIEEAKPLAAPLNDPRVSAALLHAQGIVAATEHDYARAYTLDRESHALFQQIGDVWLALIVEWTVGIGATALGQYHEAQARFANCMRTAVDLGSRWGVPFPLEAFGVLATAQKQFERGARLLGAAEGLRARIGISTQAADHPAFKELLAVATAELAKESASAARREGRDMSIDEAIAYALIQ